MAERIGESAIWNEAAKAGAALGGVSCGCMALKQLVGMAGIDILSVIVNGILWAVEFLVCIHLMKTFIYRLAVRYQGVFRAEASRFGRRTALFSALIFASFSAVIMMMIPQDSLQQTVETAMAQYGTMTPEATEAVEDVMADLPKYTFFGVLIYCTLYGTVLSSIISRALPENNPFQE